jgi:hypothetical protein
MNKKILFPVVTISLSLLLACNGKKVENSVVAVESASGETHEAFLENQPSEMEDSVFIETLLDSIMQANEGKKSLNEIRFGNWTKKDWYDNDYFRFLRQTFNNYLAGKLEMKALDPYKSLLHSKFAIYNCVEFLGGGLLVYFIFIHSPDKLFIANIYSHVDEVSETVMRYEVRSFGLYDDDSGFTKNKILEFIKKHPEEKLW